MNFKDLADARQKYANAQDDAEIIIFGWTLETGDCVGTKSIQGPKGNSSHSKNIDRLPDMSICGDHVAIAKSWRYIPSTATLYWWQTPNKVETESAEHELVSKWGINDKIHHKRIVGYGTKDYTEDERKLSQGISHGTYLIKKGEMPSFKEYLKFHNSPLYNHRGD